MGTFYVGCLVANLADRARKVDVSRALVDTGSENTWIAEESLRKIGVVPEKKDVQFLMADGRTLGREIGFAVIHLQDRITVDEVVFARPGDLQIIGARTLEGLNLIVDPAKKKLVGAGPLPAAPAAAR